MHRVPPCWLRGKACTHVKKKKRRNGGKKRQGGSGEKSTKCGRCLKLFFFFFLSTTALLFPKNSHAVRQSRPTEKTLVGARIGRSSRRARVSHATHHALLTHATSRHAHAHTLHTHAPGSSSSKCPPSSCDEGKKIAACELCRYDALRSFRESFRWHDDAHTDTPNTHTHHTQPLSAVCIRLYILKGIPYCAYQQNATGTCTER